VASIRIGREDRVDFFGRTGSGKTTLARSLLHMSELPFVVFDPKHRYTDGQVPVGTRYSKRRREQIVRSPAELTGADEAYFWDEQFYNVWKDGGRILYVDEVTLVNPSARVLLPEYSRCIKTGRERGVGVWNGSQRPKDIPSAVFTEAEHFCVFRLQWSLDRVKVGQFTSDEIGSHLEELHRGGRAAKHDWCYYNVDDDRIVRIHATKTH
jgi:DNA helicase HerA-like ATPase